MYCCSIVDIKKKLSERLQSRARGHENLVQKLTYDRSTYEARVSFDTFDNRDATDISFTLVSKHKDYIYTRRSRTFLCGTDRT